MIGIAIRAILFLSHPAGLCVSFIFHDSMELPGVTLNGFESILIDRDVILSCMKFPLW